MRISAAAVPRTRSSRTRCGKGDRELRVQGTRIIELLVVLRFRLHRFALFGELRDRPLVRLGRLLDQLPKPPGIGEHQGAATPLEEAGALERLELARHRRACC